jgi:hypothetical protein
MNLKNKKAAKVKLYYFLMEYYKLKSAHISNLHQFT